MHGASIKMFKWYLIMLGVFCWAVL